MSVPSPPDWVPPPIWDEARWIRTNPRIFEEKETHVVALLALLGERAMEAVWQQLKKRKPRLPRLTLEQKWREWKEEETPNGLSDKDIAIRLIFFWAFAFAVFGTPLTTVQQRERRIKSLRKQALRLRGEMADLRGERMLKDDSEDKTCTHIFTDLAQQCEAKAAWLEALPGPGEAGSWIMQRDFGRQTDWGYCLALAQVTTLLYGIPLYGVIAKIATVSGGRDVKKESVVYWVKSAKCVK